MTKGEHIRHGKAAASGVHSFWQFWPARKRQLISACALAALVVCSGCDRTDISIVDNIQRPPLAVEPDRVDFGKIQRGNTVKASVRLINTTGRPIRIVETRSSCGCAVADVPDEPLAAGESHSVTVHLRATGSANSLQHTVHFILDEGLDPVTLQVTGEPAEVLAVEPATIDLTSGAIERVVLRAMDGRGFRVLGSDPPIIEGANAMTTAESHELVLSADRWVEHGSPRRLTLQLDHPIASSIDVPFAPARTPSVRRQQDRDVQIQPVEVHPVLQVRPRRVDFGEITPSRPATREILVLSTETETNGIEPTVSCPACEFDLVLESWERQGDALALHVLATGREGSTGRLQAPLHVTYGSARGALTIYTSAGNDESAP